MNADAISRRPSTRRRAVTARIAVGALSAIALTVIGCGGGGGPGGRPAASGPASSAPAATDVAARSFFDRYVQPDGRVVRTDQGGDTVSEGQAYAMLIAVGTGDAARFTAVWNWTRQHLQRPDGLLSWHWRNGTVVDVQPAADADVDAARALALAADRFSRHDLRAEAARIAGAVLDHEVVRSDARVALAAGPWAVAPRTVNPSYFSPCADADLARVTGDARWRNLADDAVTLIADATDGGHRLPPDWAHLDDRGALEPIAAPDGGEVRYGPDAARVPARLAERCDRPGDGDDRGRQLAATLWTTLQRLPGDGGGIAYHLDGTTAAPRDARNPVGLVGAAAAASAGGDSQASGRLLDEAATLDRQAPTYYGAAWLALAETMPLAKAGPDTRGDQASEGAAAGGSRSEYLPAGRVRLIATTSGTDPTTTTTSSPSTTTSTAGATTTSTVPRTTTSTASSATTTTTSAAGSPAATTTTTPTQAPTSPSGVSPAGLEPTGTTPQPLRPGILTGPPSGPVGSIPAPSAPAQPDDNSTPARTAVLLAGLGVSGALGTRLGRRSL